MSGLSGKICIFALLCTVVAVIIKQVRPEYAFLIRLATTVGICSVAMSVTLPIITYMRSIYEGSSMNERGYIGNVLKALGIAVLTQICADMCRDCGEGSAASGVELIGRLEILVLCIPMLETVISTVAEVLAW